MNDLVARPNAAVPIALLLHWRRIQRRLQFERWWGPVRGVEGLSQLRAAVVGDHSWSWLSGTTFSTRLRRLDASSVERVGAAWRTPGVDVVISDWSRVGEVNGWSPATRIVAARDRPHDGRQAPAIATCSIDIPPIDIAQVNPNGLPWQPQRSLLTVRTSAAGDGPRPRRPAARSTPSTEGLPCTYLDVPAGADRNWSPKHDELLRRRVSELRDCAAAIDDRAQHESDWHQAIVVGRLAAMGVPVILTHEPSDELRALLGPELVGIIRSTTLDDTLDPVRRERVAVALARIALARFSVRGVLSDALLGSKAPSTLPSVSVLLSTRRPDQLPHALDQINRQDYPRAQIVLVLHGIPRDDGVDAFVSDCKYPVAVVVADGDSSFGEALNLGVQESGGSLIVKLDDDDWYGTHHLSDLVLAREYSGADLVGKGSEFVYLANEELTIRRSSRGHRFTPSIAGPTLLFSRALAEAVGGFPHRPSGIDWGIKQAARSVGGRIYRTHGLEFVLHRHGNQHTWEASDDYFGRAAESSWPGLRLSEAAIDQ